MIATAVTSRPLGDGRQLVCVVGHTGAVLWSGAGQVGERLTVRTDPQGWFLGAYLTAEDGRPSCRPERSET